MRPRRVVLVYCANESLLGMTCYALRLHAWCEPVRFSSVAHMKLEVRAGKTPCDAALLLYTGRRDGSVGLAAYLQRRGCAVMVDKRIADDTEFGARLMRHGDGAATLAEQVRVMATRKRGPKREPAAKAKRVVGAARKARKAKVAA